MEMPVKQAVPFGFTNPYPWPRKPLLAANDLGPWRIEQMITQAMESSRNFINAVFVIR